jgi:glyceraldehyde-3-phosphate dehydrogenase (NADP+)
MDLYTEYLARFSKSCSNLKISSYNAETMFKKLWELYQTKERTYHNLFHIHRMLDDLAKYGSKQWSAHTIQLIEMAIWFHDAIYDTTRNDNEEKSAELAMILLGKDLTESQLNHISQLILVTKHDETPKNAAEALIADLDLMTLAEIPAQYSIYKDAVYAEYSRIPKAEFLQGRLAFLRKMLAKTIFHSAKFEHLDKIAKENMERELKNVEAGLAAILPGWDLSQMTPENGWKKIEPTLQNIIDVGNIMGHHTPWYLLNGAVRPWEGEKHPVISPVTNSTIGSAPLMQEADAMKAVDAAERAWNKGRGVWPSATPAVRIQAMRKFVELMKQQRKAVVNMLCLEIAKTLPDSQNEFDRTVEYIEATIQEYEQLAKRSKAVDSSKGILSITHRAPLGVTLCMGPFNYPLNETYTTLIPAIIMGNTVVVKPAKYGILLHESLHSAFAEAFPAGVVNFIYGDGQTIINPIMAGGKIDVFAFIGTSRVASLLKKQHPRPHRLRSILGLDAKNPAIVLADADLDVTAQEIVKGALSYNGQRCTALKLIFAHESIASKLGAKIAQLADELPAGSPFDEGVKITPLPEAGKCDWLTDLVDDAISLHAVELTKNGGKKSNTLFRPVVLDHVPPQANIYTQEQFGPIIPITRYQDVGEFVDYVTESNFGQQLSIFGNDPHTIEGICTALANQVCRINLNGQCQRGPDHLPFAGRKDSAEGTLSIADALRCFSIRSVVASPWTANTKPFFEIFQNGK